MTRLTRVVCPTCQTVYQIRLEEKGIEDETYQLSCHVCQTVWSPTRVQAPKTPPQSPPLPILNEKPGVAEHVHPTTVPLTAATPTPVASTIIQPDVPAYTPPPPSPAWTPPPPQPSRPVYTPSPIASPPPPPVQSTQQRRVGMTIGMIILGTCIAMACVVGVLRHKDGLPLTWITKSKKKPQSQGSESLAIRDVRFDVQKTGQRQTILVVGMIDNPTSQAFTLHPLQVSVWGPADQKGVSPTAPKDGDMCLLIAWQHPFEAMHIEPGQSRPFQTVGSLPVDVNISRVDVTIP